MAKYRIYHFIKGNMFFWIEYSDVLPKGARKPIKDIQAWEVNEKQLHPLAYAKICLTNSDTTFGTGIKEPDSENNYSIPIA